MELVLTGASGFIGQHIARQAHARGFSLKLLGRQSSRFHFPDIHLRTEFRLDWSSPSELAAALEGADAMVHCAGTVRGFNESDFVRGNLLPAQQLVAALQMCESPPRYTVVVSSQAAAGPAEDGVPVQPGDDPRPVTWYGRSKLAAERTFDTALDSDSLVILRPSSVYGPGDYAFRPFFKLGRKGLAVLVGREPRRLQMLYGPDLAAVVLDIVADGLCTGTHFVHGPGVYTWDDLVSVLESVLQRKIRRVRLPYFVAMAAAWVQHGWGRLSGTAPLLGPDKIREYRPLAWTADGSSLAKLCGTRKSTTLEDGFRQTLESAAFGGKA